MHIFDGEKLILDSDGVERPGLDAVRAEAVAGAREILSEKLLAGEPLDGQHIEICSEAGELLEVIKFSDVMILPGRR